MIVNADEHCQPKAENDIIRVEQLKMHFPIKKGVFRKTVGHVYAVDGVTFQIRKGETLGLVGESGCGKSTVGRCMLRLYRPTQGKIFFEDTDITNLSRGQLTEYRKQMQMIFQDPYSSLNPRQRVKDIIGEAMVFHHLAKPKELESKVGELMEAVGLRSNQMMRYPHEFSGGQRQRIGIARCLALNSKVIIADEPVSALDVSIQAQVINLLDSLKEKFELSYLMIAHDLSVVAHISDRVAVMYLGNIVEIADVNSLYLNPKHPYTQALMSAAPIAGPGAREHRKKRQPLKGDVPSPINPPSGCRFHTRCPKATGECKKTDPSIIKIDSNHYVACLLYN